jgi:GTP pyrophosphokinase
VGKIRASFENKTGSLASVVNIIAANNISITTIKTSNRSSDVFEIIVDVEVSNVDELENIISVLRISGKVIEVERIIG